MVIPNELEECQKLSPIEYHSSSDNYEEYFPKDKDSLKNTIKSGLKSIKAGEEHEPEKTPNISIR